ncbi:AAA family ATPase [Streptomyces xiamenensis]|uniref:helix-turn-helix transcriptional regulator n=1 Tax=Streptomyces xiamenensis TaxID=408015 RepID=UPI003D7081E5
MIDSLPDQVTTVRPPHGLPGRTSTVTRVIDTATAPGNGPLVLVTGPLGIGRSAVLAAVGNGLAERGHHVLALRVARNERDRPYSLAARLSAELGALHRGTDTRRAPHAAAPVTHPEAGRHLTAVLRAAVKSGEPLFVLIDDLHWADPASRGVLLPKLRSLAGSPVTFVCTFRTLPTTTENDRVTLERLRTAGLAHVVPLRPLHSREIDALVAHALQAIPSDSLSERLRRDCRGIPSAALGAVAGYRRAGSLRVVDRHAYLASPDRPPEMPPGLPFVEHLRGLGAPVWPVVKALAVLHPLGSAATRLIAEALDTGEDEVRATLESLRAEGLVRHGPEPGHWRFRLPLHASSLATCLGQYERRRLSQLAVTAVWSGTATAQGCCFAEHLVTAGRFVDPARAAEELFRHGSAAMLEDGHSAARWLRAALELMTDPEQRAKVLLVHASTCTIHLRHAEARESAWAVLSRYADLVTAENLLEMEMVYIVSLAGMSDQAALTALADAGWRTLPGGPGHRIISRYNALCHLERWQEAADHLAATRDEWSADNDFVAGVGQILDEISHAFLGRPRDFERAVADPTRWPLWERGPRHRFQRLSWLTRTLMTFGELAPAQQLLETYGLPSGYRPVPDQVVADSQSGHWDRALDLARRALATGGWVGDLTSHTMASREMSVILGARGRINQARSVIENARTVHSLLLHLLAGPEAEQEQSLGAAERAHRVITDALALAERLGLVVGTDELWLRRTEMELNAGDPAAARRCAREVARVAELTGTGRSRLCHLIATSMAHRNPAAAAEAVALARHRGQPLELADTLVTVVRHGQADPGLLREAYAVYGDLDALLRKAQLRNLMRDQGVPVPGRSATTAENERLLAVLVTEGLTNREMAVALGCSEKSVESRMTRLFKRAGYRSRVELASAMLTGDYTV